MGAHLRCIGPLDEGRPLVYHRRVEGSFADEFGVLGLDAWEAAGASLEGLKTTLAPNVRLPALHLASSPLPEGVPFRQGPWLICQEYDDPRMEETATQIRVDLERGVDAVWLVTGLDHGVRMLTPGDLATITSGIDLAKTPVFLEPEGDVLAVAMSLVAVAESRGVAPEALRGGFGADPLGALVRSGSLASGMTGAQRDLLEVASFSSERAPGMRSVLVSTRAYHDAGASPVQEIAWAVATGVEYLRLLTDTGFSLERAITELQFALSVAPSLFGEVAKLRALRWIWAKAMAAAGVAPEGRKLALHARSALCHRTRLDAWVNMLRGTAETFAAALGGADSIATSPFDAAIGPSDALARRVARNTQLVLRDESRLDAVEDPAAGSWTLESITEAYAREAWGVFQQIEAAGGMTAALRRGDVSSSLDAAREARIAAVHRRAQPVVGVSAYASLDGRPVERTPIRLEDVEVELGNNFGDANPDTRHAALLTFAQTLRDRTAPPGSVADAALAAVRLGVDVFSLGTLLRTGRASMYLEPLPLVRAAAPWEEIRAASDRYAKLRGRLVAFVATLGARREFQGRLTWVSQLLAAVGIEVATPDGVHDPETAAAAMAESDAPIAVICGPASTTPETILELAPALKAKGARIVLLLGDPGAERDEYRKRGVDGFLYEGDDVLTSLTRVLRVLGAAQ
ncbi:MAG: methylmalonyl-CoA mutase family protein [Myxococcota bacterium]